MVWFSSRFSNKYIHFPKTRSVKIRCIQFSSYSTSSSRRTVLYQKFFLIFWSNEAKVFAEFLNYTASTACRPRLVFKPVHVRTMHVRRPVLLHFQVFWFNLLIVAKSWIKDFAQCTLSSLATSQYLGFNRFGELVSDQVLFIIL